MHKPRKILVILLSLLLIISSLPAIPSFVNFVIPKSSASVPTNYWGKSPAPASSIDSVQVSSNPNSLGTTVAALAGLEDRNQPKIYYTSNAQDNSWLSYIKQTYAIVSTSRSIQYIIQTYAPDWTISSHIRICEYAANDPEFPMQLDMCRTIAGVQNTLVVDSNDLGQVLTWLPTAFVYINVNSNSCNAGPDPRLLCFNWLWTNTKNATTRTVFSIPNNGRQQSSDYYVEEKMFEFEFTCAPGKTNCMNSLNGTGSGCTISTCENTFANYILNQFSTANTPAMGFFGLGGEVGTISLLSAHQIEMTANEEFSNLGFMSGFPNLIGLNQQPATFIPYNSAKVYVMFQITQGDALFYDGYYNMATWNATDPSNGLYYRTEFSTDWQINPMLAQLAPPIIKYYYATQNFLVDFSTGPSGGGYTHPDLLPNEGSFGALVSQWSTNVGIGEQFIITSSLSTATLQNYATAAHPNDILLWNQHHTPQNQILNSNNVSAMFASFWTPSIQSFSSADVTNEINQIKASAVGTHFVYVVMNAQNPGLPFIKQVLAGLPSNYVDVRADQYSCLYRQSQGKQCAAGNPTPPNYQVSFSANTTLSITGHAANFTAFSNLDVGGTPYSINIYDSDNNTSYKSCNMGTSCSVNIKSNSAGTFHFQANIGSSPVLLVQATSMIIAEKWNSTGPPPACGSNSTAPYVCLTADGSGNGVTVNIGTSVLLSASVYNLPTNQSTYSILILDLSNSTTIALCPFGLSCSVAVTSNIGFTDSYDAKLVHN